MTKKINRATARFIKHFTFLFCIFRGDSNIFFKQPEECSLALKSGFFRNVYHNVIGIFKHTLSGVYANPGYIFQKSDAFGFLEMCGQERRRQIKLVGNKNTTPISNMVSILLCSADFINNAKKKQTAKSILLDMHADFINFLILLICQLRLLHIQTVFIKQKVKYAHSSNAAIITFKLNIVFYDNDFFEGIFCF